MAEIRLFRVHDVRFPGKKILDCILIVCDRFNKPTIFSGQKYWQDKYRDGSRISGKGVHIYKGCGGSLC